MKKSSQETSQQLSKLHMYWKDAFEVGGRSHLLLFEAYRDAMKPWLDRKFPWKYYEYGMYII